MEINKNNFTYSKPINVYFECTVACDLACKHCRAEAMPDADPNELNTEDAKKLIKDVKELGSHLIISGGDPLKRNDLFELLAYAQEINLTVGVTPTTSPLATFESIKKMKDLGIFFLGISLDGANAQSQDGFRGVVGTFNNSMNVLSYAKDLGIPVQINTTCTMDTVKEIENIYYLLQENFSPPVKRWSIFFLVPVGRGKDLEMPTYSDVDTIFNFLYEKSKESPFHITTTEAPFYKTYYVMRELQNGKSIENVIRANMKLAFGVRDGNGIIFISNDGTIYPSGFLEVPLGNIKEDNLGEIYRNNNTLQILRDPSSYTGKCGSCSYKYICGGSRARAYATEGNYLAEDRLCHLDERLLINS
jgi:AdoMet-dependent heme synthase